MTDRRPKVAVVVFPGSNDVDDAAWALGALGGDAELVWHGSERLPEDTGAVVLPGGFSYGDYLRCGAIARFSPVMGAVVEFAAAGGPVLGICNGFQILCEAGLLPGVLRPNASLSFVCRDVALRVEQASAPFTSRCKRGQRLVIPVKHGEGCWFAPPSSSRSSSGRPDRPALRGRQPERFRRRRGGSRQRARQRDGPDAAPGARGRSAARLRRRRVDPRLTAGRGARSGYGARLGASLRRPSPALQPARGAWRAPRGGVPGRVRGG